MEEINIFRTITEYNRLMGVETLNPLVTIVDMEEIAHPEELPESYSFGFYTVFLKDVKCGEMRYGRNYYDFQEGTLLFLAPGQVIQFENHQTFRPKGWILAFHPDLVHGTSLANIRRDYTFFSYEINEALHISEREREVILECFKNIRNELSHAIDQHSKRLIVSNIELFLNYCTRFYERQFITRKDAGSDLLSKFEHLLMDYFSGDMVMSQGLPSVKYFADKLYLSTNYFGDLIKKETGRSAQEHIQLSIIDKAKERLASSQDTVSEVAYSLGFDYPQYFVRMFKKRTHLTPTQYRKQLG